MRNEALVQCDMRGDRRKVLCSMGNTFGGIVFRILERILPLSSPFKNEDSLSTELAGKLSIKLSNIKGSTKGVCLD